METKKRKREPEAETRATVITYYAPDIVFSRIFKEKTLDETRDTVRRKLGAKPGTSVRLSQLKEGTAIVLDDEDDFEAFRVSANHTSALSIKVTLCGAESISEAAPAAASTTNDVGPSLKGRKRKNKPQSSTQVNTPPTIPSLTSAPSASLTSRHTQFTFHVPTAATVAVSEDRSPVPEPKKKKRKTAADRTSEKPVAPGNLQEARPSEPSDKTKAKAPKKQDVQPVAGPSSTVEPVTKEKKKRKKKDVEFVAIPITELPSVSSPKKGDDKPQSRAAPLKPPSPPATPSGSAPSQRKEKKKAKPCDAAPPKGSQPVEEPSTAKGKAKEKAKATVAPHALAAVEPPTPSQEPTQAKKSKKRKRKDAEGDPESGESPNLSTAPGPSQPSTEKKRRKQAAKSAADDVASATPAVDVPSGDRVRPPPTPIRLPGSSVIPASTPAAEAVLDSTDERPKKRRKKSKNASEAADAVDNDSPAASAPKDRSVAASTTDKAKETNQDSEGMAALTRKLAQEIVESINNQYATSRPSESQPPAPTSVKKRKGKKPAKKDAGAPAAGEVAVPSSGNRVTNGPPQAVSEPSMNAVRGNGAGESVAPALSPKKKRTRKKKALSTAPESSVGNNAPQVATEAPAQPSEAHESMVSSKLASDSSKENEALEQWERATSAPAKFADKSKPSKSRKADEAQDAVPATVAAVANERVAVMEAAESQTQKSGQKKSDKKSKELHCPVCLGSPFHLRSVCPVIRSGPAVIENRLSELKAEDDLRHRELIKELEISLESARKEEKVSRMEAEATWESLPETDETRSLTEKQKHDSSTARTSSRPEHTGPSISSSSRSWTPLMPAEGELSEVTIEAQGEGSSDESDSDGGDGDDEKILGYVGTRPQNITTNDVSQTEIEALIRGAGPFTSRGRISESFWTQIEADDDDNAEQEDDVVLEDVDEEPRDHRSSRQYAAGPSSSDEEIESAEGDGYNDDRGDEADSQKAPSRQIPVVEGASAVGNPISNETAIAVPNDVSVASPSNQLQSTLGQAFEQDGSREKTETSTSINEVKVTVHSPSEPEAQESEEEASEDPLESFPSSDKEGRSSEQPKQKVGEENAPAPTLSAEERSSTPEAFEKEAVVDGPPVAAELNGVAATDTIFSQSDAQDPAQLKPSPTVQESPPEEQTILEQEDPAEQKRVAVKEQEGQANGQAGDQDETADSQEPAMQVDQNEGGNNDDALDPIEPPDDSPETQALVEDDQDPIEGDFSQKMNPDRTQSTPSRHESGVARNMKDRYGKAIAQPPTPKRFIDVADLSTPAPKAPELNGAEEGQQTIARRTRAAARREVSAAPSAQSDWPPSTPVPAPTQRRGRAKLTEEEKARRAAERQAEREKKARARKEKLEQEKARKAAAKQAEKEEKERLKQNIQARGAAAKGKKTVTTENPKSVAAAAEKPKSASHPYILVPPLPTEGKRVLHKGHAEDSEEPSQPQWKTLLEEEEEESQRGHSEGSVFDQLQSSRGSTQEVRARPLAKDGRPPTEETPEEEQAPASEQVEEQILVPSSQAESSIDPSQSDETALFMPGSSQFPDIDPSLNRAESREPSPEDHDSSDSESEAQILSAPPRHQTRPAIAPYRRMTDIASQPELFLRDSSFAPPAVFPQKVAEVTQNGRKDDDESESESESESDDDSDDSNAENSHIPKAQMARAGKKRTSGLLRF